ncbi:MAG: hypothetical protein HYY24_22090 [Verrucomicrobia bacterium]|nr:hypothetical protein [Verrucomicrobiota bacterium]
MKTTKLITLGSVAAVSLLLGGPSKADPVPLQEATATFAQIIGTLTPFGVDKAIDGLIGDSGWGLYPDIQAHTAVFETRADAGFPGGSLLTFTLHQTHGNPGHGLGRFRLSVTTENRSVFADGKGTGGDVTANWTFLDPDTYTSANGATLTELDDFSILASGTNPPTDVYVITARTPLTGITGFRLETLLHPSLPHGGPGRATQNGNFVLTELQVDIDRTSAVFPAKVHRAVEVCWPSRANKTYQVVWASVAAPEVWTNLGDPIQGTGAELCVFDSTRDRERRFYRIVESD